MAAVTSPPTAPAQGKCLGQLGQEALWALDLSVRRTVEK
jgi:hypothetical protein